MQKILNKPDFQIPDSIESYLNKAVADGKNIIVGGKAGIGKSTLLKYLFIQSHISDLTKNSVRIVTNRTIIDDITNKNALDVYKILLKKNTILTTIQSSNVEYTLQEFVNKITLDGNAGLNQERVSRGLESLVDVVIHIKQSDDRTFRYISDVVEYQDRRDRKKIVIFKQEL